MFPHSLPHQIPPINQFSPHLRIQTLSMGPHVKTVMPKIKYMSPIWRGYHHQYHHAMHIILHIPLACWAVLAPFGNLHTLKKLCSFLKTVLKFTNYTSMSSAQCKIDISWWDQLDVFSAMLLTTFV